MSKRIFLARDKARTILKKYHVDSSGKQKTNSFVDIEKIANQLGAEIVEGHFKNPSGEIVSGVLKIKGKNGKPVIAVEATDSPERKRFTIAHELGHLCIHAAKALRIDPGIVEHLDFAFRDSTSATAEKQEEIEANQFAAELLMPTDEIAKEVHENVILKGRELDTVINELSIKYRVSKNAMTIKMGRLTS
jgi:Zn-dependent peptidase ImmA (M78 family)